MALLPQLVSVVVYLTFVSRLNFTGLCRSELCGIIQCKILLLQFLSYRHKTSEVKIEAEKNANGSSGTLFSDRSALEGDQCYCRYRQH